MLIYIDTFILYMPGRGKYWEKGGLNDSTVQLADTTKGFVDIEHFDDFFYDAEPVTRYATTGTYANVAGTGGQVKWTSGTTAGNQGICAMASNGTIDPTKDFLIRARVALTTADTELFATIGAYEVLPTAADPPVLVDDYVAFELVETTLNNDWDAITGEDLGGSGAETSTATTITGALDVFHDFEISFNATTNVVSFTIDGVLRASHSTNLPLITLIPAIMVTTGDTNAKAVRIDSWLVSNSRT